MTLEGSLWDHVTDDVIQKSVHFPFLQGSEVEWGHVTGHMTHSEVFGHIFHPDLGTLDVLLQGEGGGGGGVK